MRRHYGFVLFHGLAMILVLGLLVGYSSGVFVPAQAFADGLDNFDDSSKDPAKWGTDQVKGQGQLNEVNGRLEYTTSGSGTSLDSSDRPWIATRFPYDADWSIQIDVTNTTASGAFNSFGIDVASVRLPDNEIEVELAMQLGLPLFWSEFRGGVVSGPGNASNPAGSIGAVLLSFNSAAKLFTVSYDTNPSDGYQWTEFGSFGVAGVGGSAGTADWGLNDSDQFTAYLFGYSEGVSVTSGELYGDNFQETGGISSTAELSVNEGTIGTEITITGSGFGTKKGKVYIGGLKQKVEAWSDSSITVIFKKYKGLTVDTPNDVSIQWKPKGSKTTNRTDLPGAFTLKKPEIGLINTGSGTPGDSITINGMWFGTKKGKVYLGQEKCKVKEWTMNPATGVSTLVFEVTSKLGAGTYGLEVENKIGRSVSFGFEVK